MGDEVRIEGLKEARAALKRMADPEKTRQYRLATADIAESIVIPQARANADTRMQRRAAGTLQPVKTDLGAAVRLGKGFPGAMGAEFGADRNQRRIGRPRGTVAPVQGWNQFEPWRGSDTGAGYFLWPAIREQTPKIINRYADMFDELFGDDSTGGE
jgi:hypothetical protein